MQKHSNLFITATILAGLFATSGHAAEARQDRKENSNMPKGGLSLSREDAVREAVFKHQIGRMTSALQDEEVVFFLSVGQEVNPSDTLLERFAGRRPMVKKVSESISRKYEGIFDKETGRRGIIFSVTSIKWISETEAEVEGGHYTAPLAASGHVYKVRFENGKWVVKDDEMKWISRFVIAA
jgi:hypothetical protein